MKKTFILLAMFILTIGLIGCSSDTTESEDTIEQVENTDAPGTEPEIAEDGIPTRDSINVGISTDYVDESFNNLMDTAEVVVEGEFKNISEPYLEEYTKSDESTTVKYDQDSDGISAEATEVEEDVFMSAFTDVDFTVTDTKKGETNSDDIRVKLHHGYFEDEETQRVYDVNTEYFYEFTEGNSYLLFLRELEDGKYELIQGPYGFYSIENGVYINNNKVENNIQK